MVEIRTVSESALDSFRRLHNRHTDSDESLAAIEADYSERPELLIGAYEGTETVGFAYGVDGYHRGVELVGIGVVESVPAGGHGEE